ncbi:unnamed protein product [Sphagnum troendelagicum]|uniref:Secreted protein n=1 Tax=Sphagnum troendelagicum TaxID=128251 RepID=A0ABP0UF60_9BRYO
MVLLSLFLPLHTFVAVFRQSEELHNISVSGKKFSEAQGEKGNFIKRIAAEESLDMLGHWRKKEDQLHMNMKICMGRGKCVYTKRKPLHQM